MMGYRIGAVQAHDIQGDITVALHTITVMMQQADTKSVDILCFPECFLQGYTLNDEQTKERALDLASSEFKAILHILKEYKVAIILGLIEKDADNFYNTAAIIRQGELIGTYRKVHLFERNFQPGETYPIFTVNDLTFGVNICYDARFTEGSAELAAKGAQVIFYPLNNRLLHEKAMSYRDKHIPNLVARAKESGCWVVSADVVVQNATHTGYGYTVIINPQGRVVSRVPELKSSMTLVDF